VPPFVAAHAPLDVLPDCGTRDGEVVVFEIALLFERDGSLGECCAL
jgi:hypothetical protein